MLVVDEQHVVEQLSAYAADEALRSPLPLGPARMRMVASTGRSPAVQATSADTRSTEYTPLIRDSERITDFS